MGHDCEVYVFASNRRRFARLRYEDGDDRARVGAGAVDEGGVVEKEGGHEGIIC